MLGAAVAIALFGALWFAIARGAGGSRAGDPEAALLRACYGDSEQAERLIAAELARLSGLSRGEAVARALESRTRDNR